MLKSLLTIIMLLLQGIGIQTSAKIPPSSEQQNTERSTMQLTQEHQIEAPSLAPRPVMQQPVLGIKAKAAIALDVDTDTILFEQNKDEKLPIASITKLMVAIVVTEHADLATVHTVSNPKQSGANMKLEDGERITIASLLKGSLIPSANDATRELSKEVAGSEEEMVKLMNSKAEELHLVQTHFYNVTGLDREDDTSISEENYSTVFELAEILKYALRNPVIAKNIATKKTTVYSVDGSISHELESTNELLGVTRGIEGGKTGFTDRAGQSLTTATARSGHTVITVVLHSPDRFSETASIIQQVFTNAQWNNCRQGEKCGILQ